MAEVQVRQVRSANGASPRQRQTLRSLKLGRIGKQATHGDTPQLRGMLRVVGHLVVTGDPAAPGSAGAPGRTGAPGREAEDAPLEDVEDAPSEGAEDAAGGGSS
jgi:large subunit ribosomal protein L30